MHEELPRLYINHIPSLDWLIALEFGRVDEGQPLENWRGVSEDFGYLCEEPGGRAVGFKILGFSHFDLESAETKAIWDPPQFAAPTLGLSRASAGEIAAVVRVKVGLLPTINRLYFDDAINSESEDDELTSWRFCLEAGDCMAHYGLGIALMEAGRAADAYNHLRFYAQISPANAWAHHWHGRAALEIGETAEARLALERSLEFEEDEAPMNQSRVMLARLEDG